VDAGHEVAMALRLAYLAMHRQADAALAAHGVTADQFVLLAALSESDAVTQQDLGRRICSDPNTVGAMLLLLEGRGLVARGPHPSDGRARRVSMTAKGRRLYRKLWSAGEQFRARLLAAVGPDRADELVGLLGRVAQEMTPPRRRRRRLEDAEQAG